MKSGKMVPQNSMRTDAYMLSFRELKRFAKAVSIFGFSLILFSNSLTLAASRQVRLRDARTMVDIRGKKFLCGKLSGRIKSGVMQHRIFKSDSDSIRNLQSKISRTRQARAKKTYAGQIKILKARIVSCNNALKHPVVVPTPFPGSGNSPVASYSSARGQGLDSVAIHLNGSTGGTTGDLTCNKVSDPSGAVIEVFDAAHCNALLRPIDHHTSNISFQFSVTRQVDGKTSAPAYAYVSWDQSESFSGDYRSLAPYRDVLTKEEVVHLMRWVGFGANIDTAIQVGTSANGLQNLVNDLLTPKNCENIENDSRAVASNSQRQLQYVKSITDPNDSAKKIAATYYTSNDANGKTSTTVASAFSSWLHMMRYGCNPLRERMSIYFENHFPVNLSNYEDPTLSRYIDDHVRMYRSKSLDVGDNLIAPLGLIVRRLHGADGAMLRWLNNNSNQRSNGGNANYGRELMELFLLGPSDVITGAKNYSEADVTQMTYALMGYTEKDTNETDTRTMCCTPADGNPCGTSDAFPQCMTLTVSYKTPTFSDTRWNPSKLPETLFAGFPFARTSVFKANSFASDGDNLTDYLLYQNPGVARYIAASLITNFAGLEPTEEMVGQIAEDLVANNFKFEPALKRILTSSSFFSAQAQSDCMTSPLENIVSFIRTLNLPLVKTTNIDMYADIRSLVVTSGEALMQSPSVFGYKACGKITGNNVHTGTALLSSQGLLGRLNSIPKVLNDLNATTATTGFSWKQFVSGDGWEHRTPQLILDDVTSKLGIKLTEIERGILVEYLTTAALTTATSNGQAVPQTTIGVDWSTLTPTQFDSLMTLKIPGLLELLYGLPGNQVK